MKVRQFLTSSRRYYNAAARSEPKSKYDAVIVGGGK